MAVRTIIKQSVLNLVISWSCEDTSRERCGVLIGTHEKAAEGDDLIFITGFIPGLHAEEGSANVTFTSRTWSHIYAEIDKIFPACLIVGWFHTHPGMSVFLSEMDMFVHKNFFNLPWQLAAVADPIAGDMGVFVWENEGVVSRKLWEIDMDIPDEEAQTWAKSANSMPEFMAAGFDVAKIEHELDSLKRQVRFLWLLVISMAFYSLAWPFIYHMLAHSAKQTLNSQGAGRQQEKMPGKGYSGAIYFERNTAKSGVSSAKSEKGSAEKPVMKLPVQVENPLSGANEISVPEGLQLQNASLPVQTVPMQGNDIKQSSDKSGSEMKGPVKTESSVDVVSSDDQKGQEVSTDAASIGRSPK